MLQNLLNEFKQEQERMKLSGANLIAAERQRQINVEGWDVAHDDEYVDGQLMKAARCYLNAMEVIPPYRDAGVWTEPCVQVRKSPPKEWPWNAKWWKPSDDYARNLVKSGALIAAEIDRLSRGGVFPIDTTIFDGQLPMGTTSSWNVEVPHAE